MSAKYEKSSMNQMASIRILSVVSTVGGNSAKGMSELDKKERELLEGLRVIANDRKKVYL